MGLSKAFFDRLSKFIEIYRRERKGNGENTHVDSYLRLNTYGCLTYYRIERYKTKHTDYVNKDYYREVCNFVTKPRENKS